MKSRSNTYSNVLARLAYVLPLIIPLLVILFAFISIILLLIGQLIVALVLMIAIPLAAYISYKILLIELPSKSSLIFDAFAILLFVVWVVFNSFFTSSHFFVDRDPGFYANTAVWLSQEKDLNFQYKNVFGENASIQSPGFNEKGGRQFVQGAHVLPATLGAAGQLGGMSAIFNMAVLIGGASLLALYSFMRTIIKPKWALLGTGVFSTTMPIIYFSRDTYTEPLSMAAIFTGFALLNVALAGKKKGLLPWLLSGMSFGLAIMTRIDGLMIAATVMGASLVLLAYDSKNEWKKYLAVIVPAIVAVVLLTIDVSYYSSIYFSAHRKFTDQLYLLIVASMFAGVLLVILKNKTGLIERITVIIKKPFVKKIILLTIAAVCIMMTTRSIWFVQEAGDSNAIVAATQKSEQLDIEPARKYSEYSTNWLETYLGGALFSLSLIGVVVASWKIISGRGRLLFAFFVTFVVVSGIFLWRMSITPDHIWASRRFLPVVMPSFVVLAMVALDYIYPKTIASQGKVFDWVIYVLIGIFFVVPTLSIIKPFATMSANDQLDSVQQVCDNLIEYENPAVLYIWLSANYYVQTTRAVCGYEASRYVMGGSDGSSASIDDLAKAIEQAEEEGYTPFVAILGRDKQLINGWESLKFKALSEGQFLDVERTLIDRPMRRSNNDATLLMLNAESIKEAQNSVGSGAGR